MELEPPGRLEDAPPTDTPPETGCFETIASTCVSLDALPVPSHHLEIAFAASGI